MEKCCLKKTAGLVGGGVVAALFALLSFALFSCSNMSGGGESSSKNSYPVVRFVANMQSDLATAPQEISGLVSASAGTESFFNDGLSRSAMPEIAPTTDEDGIKYYVEAVTGTPGTDSYIRHFVYGSSSTLELGLESGKTWSVTCGIGVIEIASAPNGNTSAGVQTVYMSDNDPSVTISPDNPVYTKTFGLKPSTEGSGSFSLSFYVDSTSGIDDVAKAKLVAVCDDPKLAGSSYNTAYQTGKIVFSSASNIPSGSYEFFIRIFNNESGVLLYATSQTINVFDNMTTNSWRDDGSGAFKPKTVDGKEITAFVLDGDLVTKFVDNTIYVGDMGLGLGPDDKNVGTAFAPLASVSAALKRIAANGNGKDYRIYISGTVQGCSTLDTDITTGKAKSITIEGYNDSGDKLKGYAEKLGDIQDFNGADLGAIEEDEYKPVLTVETPVPVTIQNLAICEGASGIGGSGININGSACSVTIKDGVTISGNKTGKNGGGVLVVGGKFYMKGGKITGNSAFNSSSGNLVGGGVCLRSGAYFEMTGGEISLNRACYGGGVGLVNLGGDSGSNKFIFKRGKISQNIADGFVSGGSKCGYGGGIMIMSGSETVHHQVTMTGGEISGNKVNVDSSAVEVSSSAIFEMTGGVIKDNSLIEGESDEHYHAIEVHYAAKYFCLGGSAYIPAGSGKNHCVYLNSLKDGSNPLQMAKINVDSNLSRHSQSDPLVIQFNTSGAHAALRGATVASASFDLTNAKEYIVPASGDWNLKLSSDKKSLVLDAPIWVAGDDAQKCTGTPSEYGPGTKSHPYDSIRNACAAMTDPSVDYTILVDGQLYTADGIHDAVRAASITIQGANGNNSLDVLNGQGSVASHMLSLLAPVDVTIKDLKITGAKITAMSGDEDRGGGVYSPESNTVTLSSGTLITGNKAANGGAGVCKINGKLVIEDGAEISQNEATGTGKVGGGLFIKDASLEMTGGLIKENKAVNGETNGGGIYFAAGSTSGSATISGGTITKNTADKGGGVYMNSGPLYMSGGVIGGTEADDVNGNTATALGGGLYIFSNAKVYLWGKALVGRSDVNAASTSSLSGKKSNTARNGGGIYVNGSGQLWLGYKAEGQTAAFDEDDEGVMGGVIGNYASFQGGGIYTEGYLHVADGQIAFNGAAVLSAYGGGIYASGHEIDISGGSVANNRAKLGGAIYNYSAVKFAIGGNAYIPCGTNEYNEIYLPSYNSARVMALSSPLAKHKASGAQPIVLRLNTTDGSYKFTHGDKVVQSNPDSPFNLVDTDKKSFKLAQEHVDEDLDLRFTTDNKALSLDKPIYVRRDGTPSPDTADGTKTKPFASIADACDASVMTNDSLDYTILVDGINPSTGNSIPLLGAQTIPATATAKSITIMGANGLYPADDQKAGEPKDALDGDECEAPVLDALCACPVVLGNIKITGANNGAKGGGVSRKKGDLYIQEGTLITGNKASSGFGVYLYAESETINLYMSGGKITSNEEYDSTAKCYGGGIYATKAISADSAVKCNVFIYGSAVIGGPYSSLLDTKTRALKNGGNAGTKLCGSGVYCWGNLYLGYKSANSDGSPSEEAEWKGAIRGNYTSEGTEGGVSIHGNLYMHSGEISFNYKEKNTNAGGGGIGVGSDSYIELSGGKIHHNYSRESGGGVYVNHATFKMTGGEIYANEAECGGGVCVATGYTFIMSGGSVYGNEATYGGGIYTRGQVFICGGATIGQKGEAVTSASSESVSNKANYGGGICGYDEGRIYLGYKSANDDDNKTPNEAEEWTGGIYCNSAICGGGIGAYQESNWFIKGVYMNGGTIMGNYASQNGGGINNTSKLYMTGGLISKNHCGSEGKGSGVHFALSTSVFQMSGPACVLPESDGSNDVYFKNTEIKITVAGHLAPTVTGKAGDAAADYAACIEPKDNTQVLLEVANGLKLSDYAPLFKIKPQNGGSTLVKDGLNGLEYGIGADGKYGSMIYVTESSDAVCEAIMNLVSESSQANPVNICFTTDFAPTKNVTHDDNDASYTQGTEAILRVPEGKYLNITASKPITIKKTYSEDGNIIYCENGNLSVGPNITLDGNGKSKHVVCVIGGEATFTGCEIKGSKSDYDGIFTLSGSYLSYYGITNTNITTKVTINAGTKIYSNKYAGVVSNGNNTTVTLNGGVIYSNSYAGIWLTNGGTVICPDNSAVSIYNNKKGNSNCQVYFNSGSGGYWGTSEDNLQNYKDASWTSLP